MRFTCPKEQLYSCVKWVHFSIEIWISSYKSWRLIKFLFSVENSSDHRAIAPSEACLWAASDFTTGRNSFLLPPNKMPPSFTSCFPSCINLIVQRSLSNASKFCGGKSEDDGSAENHSVEPWWNFLRHLRVSAIKSSFWSDDIMANTLNKLNIKQTKIYECNRCINMFARDSEYVVILKWMDGLISDFVLILSMSQ